MICLLIGRFVSGVLNRYFVVMFNGGWLFRCKGFLGKDRLKLMCFGMKFLIKIECIVRVWDLVFE